jgi:F-type H+-transporting ATPase subunit a
MENIHISLKADIIGDFFGFPITNTFVTSILISIILALFVFIFSRKISIVPSKFQLIIEGLTEGVRGYVDEVLENEKVSKKVFPLIISLFVFILFVNLFKFLPGTESLTYKGVHLLKPVHSDLNMTIALAIVSFLVIQFFGVFVLGFWKYGSKFFDLGNFLKSFTMGWKEPFMALGKLLLGLIELISEIAKLVSLSFRLFGNILVGGILLMLLASVGHYFLPLPILFFELFVAFLQATLFSVLTLFYIKMAISEPH